MKHRLGIIGKGYWGSKVINYVGDYFECVYYIGSNTKDISILMGDDTVKNVMILTPIETHYDLCLLALRNGKNVFCEKPITLYTDQAEELKFLADKNKLKLAVDYTFTFSKSIKAIASLREVLGPVRYYEMNSKHLGRFMEYDVYWLLSSHYLAVLDMFEDISKLHFTKIDRLYNNNVCTTGALLFESGRIETSLNYSGKDATAIFYFDNATIHYDPTSDAPNSLKLVNYNTKYKALPSDLIDAVINFNFDEKNNLKNAVEYFCNLINNKVGSNIDTAIKITDILENIV